jgi:exoribonuclease R
MHYSLTKLKCNYHGLHHDHTQCRPILTIMIMMSNHDVKLVKRPLCHGHVLAATLMDKRMVVVIDSWQADSMYPAGHYVRTLGVIGDKETETEVLLIENDINTSPFSPAVHACVPPLPWSVTQADLDDPNR